MSDEHRTTNLTTLLFSDTHHVRFFLDAQGLPWWVAHDVCAILDIKDTSRALDRLDEDEKGTTLSSTPGGMQSLLTVNEYGLYGLILRSNKPAAKHFKRWVTHDVLPQIRTTGTYAVSGLARKLPPRQRTTRVEVSLHMAKVWQLLRSTEDEWYSNHELAARTGVSPRTVRSYTLYWGDCGLLERQEVFPRHLYRLAPTAERQQARIWQHLEICTALLIRRAQY